MTNEEMLRHVDHTQLKPFCHMGGYRKAVRRGDCIPDGVIAHVLPPAYLYPGELPTNTGNRSISALW